MKLMIFLFDKKMNILSITDTIDDYNNITDYDNITSTTMMSYNCTNSDNDINIIIPALFIIPYCLLFICLISLVVYIIIKPLFNKK